MTTSDPQPPFGPDGSASPFAGPPRAKRPGRLTAVCIIAIILGALGVLGSLSAMASIAFQRAASKAFEMPQQPGPNTEFVEANRKMQQRTQDVALRFWGLNVGVALANLAVSAGLLVGGIVMFKMNGKARAFLLAVLAVAIVFEVIQASVYVLMQLQMAPILAESMPQMMKTTVPKGQPETEQVAEMGAVVAKVTIFVGIAFHAIFALVKLIFYAIGARYLCKPSIRALCKPIVADSF
jgi:hypothetical protein